MSRWKCIPRITRTIPCCRWGSSIVSQDGPCAEEYGGEENGAAPIPQNFAAIAVACDAGHLQKAMNLMDQQGSLGPHNIYWSLLRLCNQRKSLHCAKRLHAHIQNHTNMNSIPATINEYLVLTLVKCDDLESALQHFNTLHYRTVFAWTAVISGYADRGKGDLALEVYVRMLEECVHPNEYTYTSLLKACCDIQNLEMGKMLHARAWSDGLHSQVSISHSLVRMYGKCGAVFDAEKTFRASPQHDVALWTSMLCIFIQQGLVKEAIALYKHMQNQGVSPNEWTISACLQGCCILTEHKEAANLEGGSGDMLLLETGQMLHADACHRGFDSHVFIGNSLMRMYSKCGCTSEAENVFISLSIRNVVSWTSMLTLYVEQGEPDKALRVYRQMREDSDTEPDKLAFIVILQACCLLIEENIFEHAQSSRVRSLEIGRALHADARRKCLDLDVFVGNTLVHLFAKCGNHAEAEAVFSELCCRDVVSWTVMLPAFVEHGQARKALQLYQQMQKEGICLDERTFVNVVQACSKLAKECQVEEGNVALQVALEMGKAIHSDATERGFDLSMYFGSVLVNLYGQCGSISEAEHSFKKLSQPDSIAHSAMLSAYAEESQGQKALQLYKLMLNQGVHIDDGTHGCMLQACSITGNVEGCRCLHHTILWCLSSVGLVLVTGLIHAYASCASPSDALAMLNFLPAVDVVSWNALMAGFVRAGDYDIVFQKFEDMITVGAYPNEVTFLSLLSACCQLGCVQKGLEYLESMSVVYHITPKIEHYGSVLDLLGRAGDFDRIEVVLSTMQVQPDLAMWLGLLSACRIHGNVELGKFSYARAVQLQPKQAAAYMLMSNMYAESGLEERASEVDLSRQKASAWKMPGKSSIFVNDSIHTFVVKESPTVQEERFFHILWQINSLLRLKGFVPQIDQLSS